MAQQFTVQAGDTVSSIAQRFNVPTSAVSGFRSNDPNVIFPDEVLNIDDSQAISPTGPVVQPEPVIAAPGEQVVQEQQGTVVDNEALQPTGLPQGDPTVEPTAEPTGKFGIPPISLEPRPQQDVQEVQEVAPVQEDITPDIEPDLEPTEDFVGDQIDTGVDEPVAEDITPTPEDESREFFSEFGVSSKALGEGFKSNPFGTLTELISQVMEATGLPDMRADITNIANEIEELENKRDDEIAAVNDDPFKSAGTKSRESQRISDKWDKRINARVNKLTLLQGAQQDARQEAQFATTTAISMFNQQETFRRQDIDKLLTTQEKRLEAEQAFDEPLSVTEAKSLGVPFGTTKRQAFGISPIADTGFTPQDISSNILKIKTAVRQDRQFTDFASVLNGFQNVRIGVQQDDAAGDLAIVNGIAKMLDPTGVVRPAEFDTVEAAQGFLEKTLNLPFKISEGRITTAGGRERFLSLANNLIQEKAIPIKQNLETSFGAVAEGLGVDLGIAVPEIKQLDSLLEGINAGGGADQATVDDVEIETPEQIEVEQGFFSGLKTFLFGE